jgi:hypothetical protein
MEIQISGGRGAPATEKRKVGEGNWDKAIWKEAKMEV